MSKRTKGGRVKNPPAVEVPKDMIGKNTLCQFCHQVQYIKTNPKCRLQISGRDQGHSTKWKALQTEYWE